jgi:uncharacterized membrane protein YccC
MTELERMLRDTLVRMEREVTVTQENHETRLITQQSRLEMQDQAIQELRQSLNRLQPEQQKSVQHLQRLSDIHANLEPLLSRLSTLLNVE